MASSSSGSSKTGHWTRSQDKTADSDSENETIADYVRHRLEEDAQESESDAEKMEKKQFQRKTSMRSSKRRAKNIEEEKRVKGWFLYSSLLQKVVSCGKFTILSIDVIY